MDAEEIKATINRALPLRVPQLDSSMAPRGKVEALEDYLMAAAIVQGDLEEALHWIDALIEHFKTKIEHMTGFEACLPPKRQERITQADVNLAKKRSQPEYFELGGEMRLLRQTAVRQIDRLRFEAQWVISRAYSMISGA